MIKHARNAMCHCGHHFAPAGGGEFDENEINNGAADVRESVAVEKEKRRAAMTLPQEFYGFVEGGDFCLPASPLCFKRCIAL